MNDILVPLLPSAIWLMACGIAILFLLIIFGYHLYQRNRMKALIADNISVGQLAAQRDMLANELAELRKSADTQKDELLKIDADRRKQELLRVEIAGLEKNLDERRKENEAVLNSFASLDLQLARRKQAIGRLDAEIKVLEMHKSELEPMEESLQDVRVQLERGNVKLAQLAEQELKVGALMHQARDLAKEIEDLTQTLEPLRQEKNRLRLFVDQARQASAVKNEQIIEQKQNIKNLERRKSSLEEQIISLENQVRGLEKSCQVKSGDLKLAEEKIKAFNEEMEELIKIKNARLEETTRENDRKIMETLSHIQQTQNQLDQMLMRKQEYIAELASLSGRIEILKRENEQVTGVSLPIKSHFRNKSKKIIGRHGNDKALRVKFRKTPKVLWEGK